MTVGVAAICERGKYVVMAADTMQSIGRPYLIEFEHRSRSKITRGPFDKCAVAVAGLTASSSELLAAVSDQVGKFPARPMREIIGLLERCYQELRVRKLEEEFLWRHGLHDLRHLRQWESDLLDDVVVDFQEEIARYDPELELLVGTVAEDEAHLHVIKNPGKSECFDALGYCAIGSGGRHAMTSLVRSGCSPNVSLPDGVMTVLEAKIHAEHAPASAWPPIWPC